METRKQPRKEYYAPKKSRKYTKSTAKPKNKWSSKKCKPMSGRRVKDLNIRNQKTFMEAMATYDRTMTATDWSKYTALIKEYETTDISMAAKIRPFEKAKNIPTALRYISIKTCAKRERDSASGRRHTKGSAARRSRKKWASAKRKCFMKSPMGSYKASRKTTRSKKGAGTRKYCVKRSKTANQWSRDRAASKRKKAMNPTISTISGAAAAA